MLGVWCATLGVVTIELQPHRIELRAVNTLSATTSILGTFDTPIIGRVVLQPILPRERGQIHLPKAEMYDAVPHGEATPARLAVKL